MRGMREWLAFYMGWRAKYREQKHSWGDDCRRSGDGYGRVLINCRVAVTGSTILKNQTLDCL